MNPILKCFVLVSYFFLQVLTVAAQPGDGPLVLYTSFIPEPVTINGKQTLYYELYVFNPGPDSITLTGLQVHSVLTYPPLLSLSADTLAACMSIKGKASVTNQASLQPGDTAIVYLEIAAAKLAGSRISHRLQCIAPVVGKLTALKGRGGVFHVPDTIATTLGSPLRGGPWVAIYEPSWLRGHRRVQYTVDGLARIPGRYAIDFMLLDSLGHYVNGNQDEIKNWLGYDADVLAVAKGRVIAVKNDFPESPTLAAHPDYPPEKATGNYICLQVAEHRYVFYEHLKPGSIKVVAGQKISKGQAIAKLGFTGQTTGPHLHLHIADSPSPLGAEGLPFAFEQFRLLGSYPDFNRFGTEAWIENDNTTNEQRNQRPGPNTVIEFTGK